MISVVVLTHNRVKLLRQCVEHVLLRTSPSTTEIVIWNNASTDETASYLASLTDERIRVINHPENIGQSAYRPAFASTSGEYLIELDDDVIEAPPAWDETLLAAFRRVPDLGLLATDLARNEFDDVSVLRHGLRSHLYVPYEEYGIRFVSGPVGGYCAITSREIYDEVGGFRTHEGAVFWLEDAAYVADVEAHGYRTAILTDLAVVHGAREYVRPSDAKLELASKLYREAARKNAVKRALLAVPFVPALNARYGWFQPPDERWVEHLQRLLGTAGR